VHVSGAYFYGTAVTPEGFEETPVLPGSHPLVTWMESLPVGGVLIGNELRQSVSWQQGIELGLWTPRTQALVLPLRSRSEEQRLWGFLAADRHDKAFQPFETELAALYAGIFQVSLENAGLITHLAETSQALGTSYEGLESTYEALKEAQKALRAQNQKAVLGGLFMKMAQKFQAPVGILKEESAALSLFMDQPDTTSSDLRMECRRSIGQIHSAIHKVDDLVRALLRRAGQRETSSPEWIHLHSLLRQELELVRAEDTLPEFLPMELDLQAPRDLLYGVYSDFTEVLGHLISHAMEGQPERISLRTRWVEGHFRMEMEDDGAPIEARLLEGAFEPFPDLRPMMTGVGRRPGRGLSVCVQLMTAYHGTVQMVPVEQGSLVQIDFPLE
jgi:C4-dicarboxylate-specific signal transduction histidine kinase